ncbi:protein MMS22-like [Babylonia areolata]|uniref:protein MMS22-like n=1 Tax=Babylonia areolata TaxID=304850 RepID=UPI003FD4728C
MADSMTPPVSPSPQVDHEQSQDMDMDDFDSFPLHLLQDLESEAQVQQTKTAVCFQCQGQIFLRRATSLYQHVQFHDRGVLRSGGLDSVLQSAGVTEPEPTIDLFGYTFPFAALRDRTEKLFRFARQTLGEIQISADQEQSSRPKKRQYIVSFLEYVDTFVRSCLPQDENDRRRFLRLLLRQLHLLLVHAGRLSEDGSLTRYSLNQLDSVHHNFHQRLELSWYLLTILHTLTTGQCAPELPLDVKWCQVPAGEEEVRSVFDQLVSIVLYDLVTLTVSVFDKLSPHEWLLTSPFPCACVMEVWVMLIHLLRHRKETFDSESFWVQLHQILQTLHSMPGENIESEEEIDTDVFVLTISPPPSKPLGFCLWLTTHLSHLFSFDPHGNIVSPDPTQSCFFAVQLMVEKMMKTPIKEEMLRACLRCCLSVSSIWRPPSHLLTVLWEHFAKKLNDRFQLHTTSIEGLAVITKSSATLLERCRKWCDAGDTGLEQECSFHLYLRLLARLLGHNAALLEWRQIKGRFFSKFHQRRMQELQETGLHNMTCLFLTVAVCVDTEEVAKKLLGLYEMVNPSSTYRRLRLQVWCGVLAMAQLLAKLRLNSAFLAEAIATSFNSMAKQLSGSAMDFGQRQELSPLITLYIDGVRDIVELSQLDGAEHLFIGEGIDKILRSSGDSEMRHILTALDSVVMRLRCLVSRKKQGQPSLKENHASSHVAFADHLWLHVYPFVCDHSLTLTPPLSLADLALSFAHLALDLPPPWGICAGGVTGVVRQFVLTENLHAGIACHFLNQLLADEGLRNAAVSATERTSSSSVPSSSSSSSSTGVTAGGSTGQGQKAAPQLLLSQTDVVKCWWRCVLLMPQSSSSLMELSRHVTLLPDISRLLSCQQEEVTHSMMKGPVSWKQMLKAIGSQFSKAQSLLDKQKLRGQVMPYFADSTHQVAAVVRSSGPAETLHNVYRVLGSLLKYCSPLLYLQSKPCPLPEIIKSLILPPSVFNTDRPLNPHVLAALRDTLHLYLEGLGRLDYHRDSFIQRQVRSIVTQFLPRFPLSVVDVYSHPVLKLLGRLPHQTTFTDPDFHRFVADIAIENLKKINSSTAGEVVSVLKMCHTCS